MMNYSGQVTYGRKVVKGNRKKSEFCRLLYTSWFICFTVGLIIGGALVWGITSLIKDEPAESAAVQVETESPEVVEEAQSNNEVLMDWGGDFIPLDVPMDEDMQEFVYLMSNAYDVDFSFVMALIEHESAFTANVISETSDHGLMQVNSINHTWLTENLGITDFLDPYQNVKSGIFILSKLFDKYEEPAKVLMAYNMGEKGAKRAWENGIFETNYSNSIIEQAAEYQKQLSEKRDEQ